MSLQIVQIKLKWKVRATFFGTCHWGSDVFSALISVQSDLFLQITSFMVVFWNESSFWDQQESTGPVQKERLSSYARAIGITPIMESLHYFLAQASVN